MLTYNARIVLDTLLPQNADADLPLGLFDVDFDGWYQQWVREAPPHMIIGFHAGLLAATWFAPLLIKRPPPLSMHSRETRERALMAMYSSPIYTIRQIALVLKVTATFCYGGDANVRRAVGFPSQFDEPDVEPEPT